MEVHASQVVKVDAALHVLVDVVADVLVTVLAIVLVHVEDVVATVVQVAALVELYWYLINGKNKGKKTRVARRTSKIHNLHCHKRLSTSL